MIPTPIVYLPPCQRSFVSLFHFASFSRSPFTQIQFEISRSFCRDNLQTPDCSRSFYDAIRRFEIVPLASRTFLAGFLFPPVHSAILDRSERTYPPKIIITTIFQVIFRALFIVSVTNKVTLALYLTQHRVLSPFIPFNPSYITLYLVRSRYILSRFL